MSALHYQATGELMRLMDGFYSNIEDGLFEMAYASSDPAQQRETVDLMRELRFRREQLLTTFAKRMQSVSTGWYKDNDQVADYLEQRIIAEQIAARSSGHFGGLLQAIAERVVHATDHDIDRRSMPLAPEEISYHFVMSCRALRFDQSAIGMVQDLFHRFVLDRLGALYGPLNQQLAEAGFLTFSEIQEAAAAASSA